MDEEICLDVEASLENAMVFWIRWTDSQGHRGAEREQDLENCRTHVRDLPGTPPQLRAGDNSQGCRGRREQPQQVHRRPRETVDEDAGEGGGWGGTIPAACRPRRIVLGPQRVLDGDVYSGKLHRFALRAPKMKWSRHPSWIMLFWGQPKSKTVMISREISGFTK